MSSSILTKAPYGFTESTVPSSTVPTFIELIFSALASSAAALNTALAERMRRRSASSISNTWTLRAFPRYELRSSTWLRDKCDAGMNPLMPSSIAITPPFMAIPSTVTSKIVLSSRYCLHLSQPSASASLKVSNEESIASERSSMVVISSDIVFSFIKYILSHNYF